MISQDWKRETVADLCDFINGNGFKPSDWSEHGLPIIRIQNLNGSNDFNYFSGTPKKTWLVHNGDILFAWAGTKGVSFGAKRWSGSTGVLNQHIFRVIPKIEVDVDWLYLAMLTVTQRVENKAHGFKATLLHVQKSDITDQTLDVPPLPEQKKIAKILSTWDKAITTTEQLLANSQQQKKALMQQLLTGKKRLKGFSGEWEEKHLVDISKIIVSPVDKKTVEGEEHILLCNYTDVYYNHTITRRLRFMQATASKSEIERFMLQKGDVIITKDSETPGDIAIPALVSEELSNVVCGYHLAIIRPKKKILDGAFLNYLFSMPKIRYYFFTLATGATRFGLSIGGINKAQFKLPPLEEQQAIAAVLSAADREIEVLQQKLEGLKQEKKALMQQLLTGKRRVSIN
jgi:type I restriction enzyme S subunit